MDDGSAKCLLDVINDPNALQEFLRSNNQDHNAHSKTQVPGTISQSGFENHLANTQLNTADLKRNNTAIGLGANARVSPVASDALSNVNSISVPQSTFMNAVANNNTARTVGSSTPSYTVASLPPSVPVSSGLSFMKASTVDNSLNKGGSSILGMSPTSAVTVNSASGFQGKKPIPIQPKTPNASSSSTNTTTTSTVGVSRQVVSSAVSSVTHTINAQQSLSPGAQRVLLNGVESKANVKANPVSSGSHSMKSSLFGKSQPVLQTTPVKRIAPKQPTILPQSGLSSPPQMVSPQHKILLQQVPNQTVPNQTVPKVQTAVNQVSSGSVQQPMHSQLLQAQQLLNLIRGQNSPNQTAQQASPQPVQSSQALPANQIKQIQQLVQQKLPNQQVQVVQNVSQDVLRPTQLQGSLKPNQQLTVQQTSDTTQPQNIVLQEEVIKQLLQQVTQQKPGQNVIQQQPQIFQQIVQRPVQKQLLVQAQSSGQGQQIAQFPVSVSSQINNANLKLKTEVASTSAGNAQLQQVLNNQQKQIQQILGQQQVNVVPQPNLVISKDQGARLLQGVTVVQNQPVTLSTVQMVNRGNVVQQAKPVVAQGQAVSQPLVQVVSSASNIVPQTQQAQNTGVQKVFIIKQPELLQRLGLQGSKTQQTIQITPQQLQALKQFQVQQQATKQKLIVNNVQPKSLTTEQLKQLQLQQQLQGSAVKQVVVQNRTQPILQQQQQRQVNVKSQAGKMQHIPRILQTSGRQPVSQSVKVSVPVKQEINKGVKRPHSVETTETPKVATRLKQRLTQDQQSVLRPDVKTPFISHEDIVKRLTPYHVSYDPSPTPEDIEKADGLFSSVSTQLVKRSQRMMEKHRQLLFDESVREHPSAEMVMLYRVFLTNERTALAEEKKKAKDDPQEFLNFIKQATHETSPSNGASAETPRVSVSSKPQTSSVSSTTKNDFVSKMNDSAPEASSKISTLDIDTSTLIENSRTNSSKTEHSSTSSSSQSNRKLSLISASTSNGLSDSLPHENHQTSKQTSLLIDKAVENLAMDSLARENSSLDVPMDTETEKEDVTATLALLNSMACELDEVLDVEGTI